MVTPAASQPFTPTKESAHALVIGGGIAGLLCAHMLKDRYTRVTVLERSEYAQPNSSAPAARSAVPQSHCLHMLMGAGARAFDDLVPGWRAELIELGAVPYDAGADVAMRVSSGWLPRVETGITLYGASRCLIETALTRLLSRAGNIRIRQGDRVMGLTLTPDASRVSGVRVQTTTGVVQVLDNADLVIDASGAASRLPRWLAQHFGDTHHITRTEIAPGRQYVSLWVRLPADKAPDWQGLALAPTRQSSGRAGMIMRAENDLWGVVLQTPETEPLPTDGPGVLKLAAGLSDPTLSDILEHAETVATPHLFGRTANRRRRYEDYPSWPENLFALGDSVCALDPYAGLGMTAAARGVQLLSRWLDQPEPHARSFQSQLARHNEWPWRIATGTWTDPEANTNLTPQIESLVQAAPFDPALAIVLLEFQHMLRAPESLLNEAVA
ncbi:FAD-dependent oxidoreductase [Ruegeria lacuscaerulensis]|uniref:FAD-dependent oxidoreductase n=1 Tax=Ruegeria lacuscaerulensis TaxID=55218 RepID=UPI00147CC9EF|nr:FAD-dependent oxidoreductase [Ruegeria lacuscaerulensis]